MPSRKAIINKNDLSRRKRRQKKKRYIYLAIFCALVLAGFVIIMRLPGLRIKAVASTETSRVTRESVLRTAERQIEGNYFGVLPRDNFLIYPKKAIQRELQNLSPAILSASLEMGLEFDLFIDVKERLAHALWCRDNVCFLMDKSGVIFAPAKGETDLLQYSGIVEGDPLGKNYGAEKFFEELSGFVTQLAALGLHAKSVKILPEENGAITFENGSSLIFLPADIEKEMFFPDLELFITNLKAKNRGVMPDFEYIDARYGSKIFYRLKQ